MLNNNGSTEPGAKKYQDRERERERERERSKEKNKKMTVRLPQD